MRLTALTFVLLTSTIAWAGEPASLSTAGKVWTNKVLLPSGTTLHEGDHVKTGPASTAVIASRSTGRVEIRENSSAGLGEGQVILHEGVVSTAKAAVQIGDIQIKPQGSADALVVVAKRGSRTLIAAHRGDALIRQPGASPLLLAAGQVAVPAKSTEESASGKAEGKPADDEDDDGAAAPAGSSGSATQAGGWTIGSLSHASSVALVAGIGAAAVAGTAAGFALTEDSPSPSTTR